MSEDQNSSAPARARGWWIWTAVVVVAIVVAVWGIVVSSQGGEVPGGGASGPPSSGQPSNGQPSSGPSATPTRTAPPLPTSTPLPAPTKGALQELAPVDPTEPSDDGQGLEARIITMKAVQGEAAQAGEIQGPAVQFTLGLANRTDEPIDLGLVAVNVYIGADRTPASSLVKPGGAPFQGTLKPERSAEGVYVYSIPVDRRDDVTVTVDYRASMPAFVFRGAVG